MGKKHTYNYLVRKREGGIFVDLVKDGNLLYSNLMNGSLLTRRFSVMRAVSKMKRIYNATEYRGPVESIKE